MPPKYWHTHMLMPRMPKKVSKESLRYFRLLPKVSHNVDYSLDAYTWTDANAEWNLENHYYMFAYRPDENHGEINEHRCIIVVRSRLDNKINKLFGVLSYGITHFESWSTRYTSILVTKLW